MKTRTSTGTEVTLIPSATDRHGKITTRRGVVNATLTHPQAGPLEVPDLQWTPARKDAPEGAWGHVRIGGKETTCLLTIPRADFDQTVATAREMALAAMTALREKASAIGCELATYTGGTEDSVGYEAVLDGARGIIWKPDTTLSEGGYSLVPSGIFTRDRLARQREEEARAQRQAGHALQEAHALEKARTTGQEVLARQWSEPCDGSATECDLDIVFLVATPAGELVRRRHHTH